MMNVKVPSVQGYDEDQIAIVMDDPGMTEWPVILGDKVSIVLGYWIGRNAYALTARNILR